MYKKEYINCIKIFNGSSSYEIHPESFDYEYVKYYVDRTAHMVIVEFYNKNKKVREILGAAIDVQFNVEEK